MRTGGRGKHNSIFEFCDAFCETKNNNWFFVSAKYEIRRQKNLGNSESRPHSFPRPLSAGGTRAEPRRKNFFPQKNRFSFYRVHIEALRTAQKLLGQNPERKTPFPFSKEISPPPNQKCKECFFFRGCWRTRQCVGLSPNHLFWK